MVFSMWNPLYVKIHFSDFDLLTKNRKSVNVIKNKYQYMAFKAKDIEVLRYLSNTKIS